MTGPRSTGHDTAAPVLVDDERIARLVEANEQLVLAAMRQHADSGAAERPAGVAPPSAERDALTGLPNRTLLLQRFATALAASKRDATSLALLFVDLRGFRQINQSLGHAMGDHVLRLAAHCLTSCVREADTVSRHGGDEFLILLRQVSRAADAGRVADKVIAALGEPRRVGAHLLCLSASVGISVYPDDGREPAVLIDQADAAMHRAKTHGPESRSWYASRTPQAPAAQPPRKRFRPQLTPYEVAHAERDMRNAQLQVANEQLVLAAIDAQTVQAAAQEAYRRQTRFMVVVAHELRNPLTPIRLAASMIGRGQIDQALLPRAQAIIERQVGQMTRLIDDMLDVTRVKTGKLHVDLQVCDVGDVVDAVLEACRPAIDSRLQALVVSAPAFPLLTRGDPVRLAQVFSNLVTNASKYTPEGGRIEVSVTDDDFQIVVTVSDSGIGISSEALPDIFEPFVQDAHAVAFDATGLGVGLTVVRQLVAAHGGTVVGTSAGRGLGSRFVVTLPVLGAAAGSPAPA